MGCNGGTYLHIRSVISKHWRTSDKKSRHMKRGKTCHNGDTLHSWKGRSSRAGQSPGLEYMQTKHTHTHSVRHRESELGRRARLAARQCVHRLHLWGCSWACMVMEGRRTQRGWDTSLQSLGTLLFLSASTHSICQYKTATAAMGETVESWRKYPLEFLSELSKITKFISYKHHSQHAPNLTCYQSTPSVMETELLLGVEIRPNCSWLAPVDSWLSSNCPISIVTGEGTSLMLSMFGQTNLSTLLLLYIKQKLVFFLFNRSQSV